MNRFRRSDRRAKRFVATDHGPVGLGLELSDFGNSYSAPRSTPSLSPDLANGGVKPFISPWRNQGETSSCGGFCISDNLEALQAKIHRSTGQVIHLSAMDAYWWARPPKHRDEDEGILTSDLLRVINHQGCCERTTYPDDAHPLKPPAAILSDSVQRFHSPRPYQHVINETADELFAILHAERLPCALLLKLFERSVEDALRSGILHPPKRGDRTIGGHATTGSHCIKIDGTRMVCARFNWGPMRLGDGTIAIHPDYFREGHVVALAPPADLY